MPAKTYQDNTDPKRPSERVVISQFGGMAPTQDPHESMDAGLSAFQINCFTMHPGELRCRQGIKLIQFTPSVTLFSHSRAAWDSATFTDAAESLA